MIVSIPYGTMEMRDVVVDHPCDIEKLVEVSVMTSFIIRADGLQEFEDALNKLINQSVV